MTHDHPTRQLALTLRVPLTNGMEAFIDAADEHLIAGRKWRFTSYVVTTGNASNGRRDICLHKIILPSPPGMVTDHINRNRLDCRRTNLRVATYTQNRANTPPNLNNFSGFKGVTTSEFGRYWTATITVNKRCVKLGKFGTPEEAALAYDRAAYEAFGEFAYLNFPDLLDLAS